MRLLYSFFLWGTIKAVQACDFTLTNSSSLSIYDVQAAIRAELQLSHGTLDSDVIVCLNSPLIDVSSAPLKFTADDAVVRGRGRVVWQGAPGSIISGGTQVTGWTPTTLGGGDVYVATVPPGIATSVPLRQLWVGGSRANRTVLNGSTIAFNPWVSTSGSAGYMVPGGVPVAWSQNGTKVIEFTFALVVQNWIEPRCTVESIVGENITLISPCGAFLAARYSGHAAALPPPVRIEAVPLWPLRPGTFYHDIDNGFLYYALAPWQTAADLESDAWVSTAEVLMSYSNCSGHTWSSVSFAYGAWAQVNGDGDGYVEVQSAVYACTPGNPGCNLGNLELLGARAGSGISLASGGSGAAEPPANVRVSASSNLTFDNCTFSHIGSAYALSVVASNDIDITRNTYFDLSGGALKLGSVGGPPWSSRISIVDNIAHGVGVEYRGAAAFFGGYLASSNISHNTITDASYSGLSLGWGWGGPFNAGVGGNVLANNRFERVMTELRDGGGIYVNGKEDPRMPSTITGNYVDSDEAVYAVYYLDGGASYWIVSHNVLSNAPLAWALYTQGDPACPATFNTIDHLWYSESLAPNNQAGIANNNTFDTSTIYNVTNQLWPKDAEAIIANAGARSP